VLILLVEKIQLGMMPNKIDWDSYSSGSGHNFVFTVLFFIYMRIFEELLFNPHKKIIIIFFYFSIIYYIR
jgi:hypothetical protein